METTLTMTTRQAELADFIFNIKQFAKMKLSTTQRWDLLLNCVYDSDLYVTIAHCKTQKGAIDKAWEVYCRPAWLQDQQAKGKPLTHVIRPTSLTPMEWQIFLAPGNDKVHGPLIAYPSMTTAIDMTKVLYPESVIQVQSE
jgi:hypothetical protein